MHATPLIIVTIEHNCCFELLILIPERKCICALVSINANTSRKENVLPAYRHIISEEKKTLYKYEFAVIRLSLLSVTACECFVSLF